ncbi:hypothetical protein Lesp02_43260 [Lentzea sp. NBRC 105346]|uniref:hypothetical protein n=1 Tax=Lentzea sp. NBRC 105346 TaxID=3032205 RepID=UPI0024A0BDA1|nr:hypothetical protein [Lentzea sp. NBRC 105346]GLZ32138.1 hypothetical protein Lesp02_43260 [Lentzea sp. NBRC 105346]
MTKGIIAVGAALALGLVGVVAVQQEDRPTVDAKLTGEILPVIDDALQQGPWSVQDGRWFCAEHVIEVRPAGDGLKVGLQTRCDAYAADLHEVGGQVSPVVVALAKEPYRVIRIERAQDGAAAGPWLRSNFSSAGAREVDRWDHGPLGEQVKNEAREAYQKR